MEYRGEKSMALVLAQTDISSYLENNLFSELTAILTSATLNDRIKYSLGLANFNPTELSLDSPFDYESNALIYCPKNLETNYSESRSQTTAKIPIIKRLIQASRGRSLILCTSHKSVTEIYDALQFEIDYKLYRQDEYPKQVLLNKFKENESSCLDIVTDSRIRQMPPIHYLKMRNLEQWTEVRETEDRGNHRLVCLISTLQWAKPLKT